ncbi:TonB family protein [Parabacteroides sp. PF5-5]|uniref:M56 family metallopeptidase n=1 Tax=unclassified Parabacteroides TaxID=2649774 RepID=UPI0024750D77|nr:MULTISPECIES: M56 family metallopeptidase [unclassified Parabacteroides]MDH6306301.1 TonB family protein [Parabacteroides sp. PH5-39]MDH6316908.1 TonB family protein [Parabacteroides sp. PF5-13]MDH6320977.1 TonB family protein [Parabacteroides sp. PH5-13]MDH6324709.1 TonB family protein [Parabacteroides sp. PH5-8]MDH6328093.1 TonB family protein [Parabacteroides sp. PH5-41]
MTPEFAYFVKVNVAFMLFYAFYRLFFYKDTFFKLRRSILLVFFGLAFAYPLLNIQEWVKEQEPIAEVIQLYSVMLPEVVANGNTATAPDWKELLVSIALGVYWLVIIILFARFLVQLASILWLRLNSKRTAINQVEVYVLERPAGPFSFFHLIFLHPASHSENELEEILTHEQTHARQWHSIDVIISELICVLCWINPFVWLLKREVRHNLEYLADHTVLQSGYDSKNYQYHLLGLAHHSNQTGANLYNSFNVLHLKNRINMMNKKRSRTIGMTKYLIFIPLAAILMLLSNMEAVARITKEVTKSEEISLPDIPDNIQILQDKPVFTVVDEMPKFPGGVDELLKFINQNVKYPEDASAKGVEGRVICSFIVRDDGSVSDPRIVRGVDPLLDAEAIRVIKLMPKWTPGKHKGEVVNTKYTIPISFSLGGKQEKKKEVAVVDKNSDPNNRIYTVVDEMPKYPGGEGELMKFIAQSVQYPAEAETKKLEGRVICSFVVRKDGSITDPVIVRGVDPLLDAEAIRVVNLMPTWTPGTQNGQAVNVKYTIPITFRMK